MKQLAFLFFACLFTIGLTAQDELALTHQTITAKAHEMKVFDPVYLDLTEEQQILADEIVQLLIKRAAGQVIAKKLALAAKATNTDQMQILRWAIREATFQLFGMQDNIEARTWTYKNILETESAANLKAAIAVQELFPTSKAVINSIE